MAPRHRKQFLFLNQSLTSSSRSQREIELQDADRRAHAARHSRHKPKRHSTRSNASHSSGSPVSTRDDDESISSDSPGPGSPSHNLPSSDRTLALRPKTPQPAQARLAQLDTTHLTGSTILLGQGYGDPFDTASVQGLPSFVHDMLEHCK